MFVMNCKPSTSCPAVSVIEKGDIMSKKLPLKHIALTVICSAVLAACGGGGSPDAKLVDNAISARKVINMIEALDSVEK